MSQLFLGVVSIGILTSRGMVADLSFQAEELTGESNYAATRLSAGHARASNAIADNNVLAVAAMGPRLAVEADNITMDESAKIACPQLDAYMQYVCRQYTLNKPRALEKLTWIRDKQSSFWHSLEGLSRRMDKVAGAHGREDIETQLAGIDPKAHVAIDDPTMSKETWGGKNAGTACSLSRKDALPTPMVGHAFPLLMPNLLPSLPQTLVSELPTMMCPADEGGAASAKPASSTATNGHLAGVPTVFAKAQEECDRLEEDMRSRLGETTENLTTMPEFSKEVQEYVHCEAGSPKNPLHSTTVSTKFTCRRGAQLLTCAFDRQACMKKKLGAGAMDFLKSLGLSSIPDYGSIGGSSRGPSSENPNESDDFRACATTSRDVDGRTLSIADTIHQLLAFDGQDSMSLTKSVRRTSCGKWYFPTSSNSPFANVPREQQSFVGAWRHALVAPRGRR